MAVDDDNLRPEWNDISFAYITSILLTTVLVPQSIFFS